jgi:hypothetical protein
MNDILSLTLAEYLEGARLCLEYKKDRNWPALGRLGFPSALLLFSVIDAIGSYLRGSSETFRVDGKFKAIKQKGFQHFFVLNGDDYWKQNLAHAEIKHVYDNYRSLLAHHAVFTPQGFLSMSASDDLFPRQDGKIGVNLTAFYNLSTEVVPRFLSNHRELDRSPAAQHILRGGG